MIVGSLFISCNSEMKQTDTKSSVSVSVANEKEIATDANTLNVVNVDDLYWYYSATKTSGAFVHGQTAFKPVKTSDNAAAVGLTNAELGQFSNGDWDFVFKAYFEAIEESEFATAEAVYTTSASFNLTENKNLVLYLEEGDAMPGNGFKFTEGVTFYAANLEDPTVARLYVYEGENLIAGPIEPEDSGALDNDGYLTFVSEDSYSLPVGEHTLTFKVTVPGEGEALVEVGSEPILINVGKGVTQTLSGPIADDDAHALVTVENYATNYTVTFNVNGGEELEDNEMKVKEILESGFPTPEKEGYEFAGWFTVIDGGTQATLTSISNLVEDCTLYAHWEEAVVKVSGFWYFSPPNYWFEPITVGSETTFEPGTVIDLTESIPDWETFVDAFETYYFTEKWEYNGEEIEDLTQFTVPDENNFHIENKYNKVFTGL